MKNRTYYGVNIGPVTSPGPRRAYGARWEAYCGRFLYADTLDGIKRLVREALKKSTQR